MHRFHHLEEQLATARDDVARLRALNELASSVLRAGNAERAMPLAREAEGLARDCGDDIALAHALSNIGMGHCMCADYVAGLEESLQALVAAERARDPKATALALIAAAGCQYQMGAREEALQALYQALEALEESPSECLLIRAHNGLGTILSDKGRLDESEVNFRRALDIGAASGDALYVPLVKMNYAGLHHERGLMLERCGMKEEANAHYRAGIGLCEEVAADVELEAFRRAHWACMLGELCREIGDAGRANDLFAETLAHATRIGNPHLQAEALMNLGKTCMALGDPAEARMHFERALDLASTAKVRRLTAQGFLSLGAWFEESGDVREALAHYKRYQAVNDDLQRAEVHATGMAHQIWLRFQQLRREVKTYQEHAELLTRDNGELARHVDRLARFAHEDPLTGLSNRRYLDERLSELPVSAREQAARSCVAIVDIDHFKAINDLHSHSVGDAVLRTVAGMIGAHCREGDFSARYGGDEFVIGLVGARLGTATKVLERLCSVVAGHDWADLPAGMRVTLSIGVTEVEANDSVGTLMHRVDGALYRAKRAGRNCVIGEASLVVH